MNKPEDEVTNHALEFFLGIVALSIVGRDRADKVVPGQDFGLRLRLWKEKFEIDPKALTAEERIVIAKLVEMLMHRIEVSNTHWDMMQSWFPLTSNQDDFSL